MAEEKQSNELETSLKEYAQVQYEIASLELSDRLSTFGAGLLSGTMAGLAFLVTLLFLSIAAAFHLAGLLGNYALGFGIVGGVYLVLFLFILLLRSKVLAPMIKDKIIHELNAGKD